MPSSSTTSTRGPDRHAARAITAVTVVFPTPPLPATTTTREAVNNCSGSTLSGGTFAQTSDRPAGRPGWRHRARLAAPRRAPTPTRLDRPPHDRGTGRRAARRRRPVDVLQVSGLFDPILRRRDRAAIDDADDERVAGADPADEHPRRGGLATTRSSSLLERVADAPRADRRLGRAVRRPASTALPAQLLAVADVTGMAPGAASATSACRSTAGERRGRLRRRRATGCATARSGSEAPDARACSSCASPTKGIPTVTQHGAGARRVRGRRRGARHHRPRRARRRHDRGATRSPPSASPSCRSSTSCSTPSPARPWPTCCCSSAWRCWSSSSSPPASASPASSARCAPSSPATGSPRCRRGRWAVALIVLAMLAFAIDVQVGHPALLDRGRHRARRRRQPVVLFEPLPATSLRPSLDHAARRHRRGRCSTFIVGMPSMVRTRFATPTIGREWMIGEIGTAVGPSIPRGSSSVGDAEWRARTNRATPIAPASGAGGRHRRRHARGRAARGRGTRLPRAPLQLTPSDIDA